VLHVVYVEPPAPTRAPISSVAPFLTQPCTRCSHASADGDALHTQVTFNLPTQVQVAISCIVIVIPLFKFALMLSPVCDAVQGFVQSLLLSAFPSLAVVDVVTDEQTVLLSGSQPPMSDEVGVAGMPSEIRPSKSLSSALTTAVRVVSRVVVTGAVVAVAAVAPFFGLVTSLTGSLLSLFVCVVFPAASFVRLMWTSAAWYELALCCVLVVVGVTMSMLGTISAAQALGKAV